MTNRLGAGAPIFRVANVRASLAYYVEQLGFTVDWDEGGLISVTRPAACSVAIRFGNANRIMPRPVSIPE